MDRFGMALSTEPDWEAGCGECAAGLATEAGEGDLGFLYVTDHLAPRFAAIAERMRSAVELILDDGASDA